MGASLAERKRVRAVELAMECIALLELDRKLSQRRRQIRRRVVAYMQGLEQLLQDPELIEELAKPRTRPRG